MTKRRWLRLGAILSVLGVVIGVLLSAEVQHRYSGATIMIRMWLVVLSAAIAVPSMVGAACMAKAAPWWPIQALFAGAALCWLAQPISMLMLVGQPLDPAGGWVAWLTALVGLPWLLRALAMFTSRYGRLLSIPDAVLAYTALSAMNVEVIARAHPAQGVWWMVLPCVLSLIAMGMFSDA